MHHTGAKLCSAAQQFGAPRLSDRALFAGLKAVDECGRDSGTLLGREPKDVFKHMVNSSVPVERQSIQQAASAAPSLPITPSRTTSAPSIGSPIHSGNAVCVSAHKLPR